MMMSSNANIIAAEKSGNYHKLSEAGDTGHKVVTADKEIVLIGDSAIVEVKFKKAEKKKSQNHISTMRNPGITKEGSTIEKEKFRNNNTTQQSWAHVLGEQVLKATRMKEAQPSKFNKPIESKENLRRERQKGIKKNERNEKRQGNSLESNRINKHSNATSLKKMISQKKSQHPETTCRNGNPLSPFSVNSIPSVVVTDRAVQYPEISDGPNKFDQFNPVRTLSFLMRELEDLVQKDKRTSEIFTEMAQLLSRISSTNPEKALLEDLGSNAIYSKLEASTAQLKESSKKIKVAHESWASERTTLQSQIHKQNTRLKEANQKQAALENHVKLLTQRLEETNQATESKEDIIKQQIKRNESLEKIILNLKAELDKQTELARKKHIEIQYLTMDKDKLSVLSSYKDTLISETRNIMKDLQNHIQSELNELRTKEVNANSQIHSQVIHTGNACSSPIWNISDSSDISISLHNLSDTSLFMAEHMPQQCVEQDANVKDSAHSGFISLPGGESSYSVMPNSSKSQVTNDKEVVVQHNNKAIFDQNINADDTNTKKLLHHSSRKDHNKKCNPFNAKKFVGFKRKQIAYVKDLSVHNALEGLENTESNKPVVFDMKEKAQNMLCNMETRIPVNVPSPLRDYPHPDWSDSSLPSISTASELDIVPSNNI